MSASPPRRRPTSARAARGTASTAAARSSLYTRASEVRAHSTTGSRARPLFGSVSGGQFKHPLHGPERAEAQVFGQRDLRFPIPHAQVQLLQRVEAHVGADAAIA